MRRYLRLYARYFTTSLIREMEFRSGAFSLALTVLVQFALTLLFFSALYGSVPSVKGWTYPEALLLLGTFQIMMNVSHALFYRNFSRTSEYVKDGKLDILLTKPVDAQFAMTTRYVGIADLLNLIPSVALVTLAASRLQLAVSFTAMVGYLSLLISGTFIIYGIWFAISILSFWLTQVDEIQELWDGLEDFTRYPRQIFRGPIQILFTFVIPILTIVSFPAEWLLHQLGIVGIIINVAIASGFLVLTRIFWRIGLQRYSSASS